MELSSRRKKHRGGRRAAPYVFAHEAVSVRHRRLRIGRIGRVLLNAAHEIERGVQRLIVLRIRRDVGLRAGLLVALGLEMAAQEASPRVSVRVLSSSGTSWSTSISGEMPLAWIERPDG